MMEFKREPRYYVLKIKDIDDHLTTIEKAALHSIGHTVAIGRSLQGKPLLNTVVVEEDWPEFEMVWAAIDARMTGKQQAASVPDSSIDAAAKMVAEHFDYPWDYMPEQGRDDLRRLSREVAKLITTPAQAASVPEVKGVITTEAARRLLEGGEKSLHGVLISDYIPGAEPVLPKRAASVPANELAIEVAEILYDAGWRSTSDAQWSGLKAAMPKLRGLLAAAPEAPKS